MPKLRSKDGTADSGGPSGRRPLAPGTSAPLLCDEMLHGLGRWLRAAGYDTVIAGRGAPDQELLDRARREGRFLLTCDRALALRPAHADRVHVVTAAGSTGPAAMCAECARAWSAGRRADGLPQSQLRQSRRSSVNEGIAIDPSQCQDRSADQQWR